MKIYYIGKKEWTKDLFNDTKIETAKLDDALDWLMEQDEFVVDIETSWKFNGKYNYAFKGEFGKNANNPNAEGLDPKLTDIIMVQIGDKDVCYVVDARDFGVDWLGPFLESNTIVKIGQNLKFEYKHFREAGWIMNNMWDTKIAEQVLYTGFTFRDNSLAGLVQRYLSKEVDKSTRLEFGLIGDKPFTARQIEYGAEDIFHPALIKEYQDIDLHQKDVHRCFSLEMRFLPVLADIEYEGMHFNKTVWMETYDENLVKVEEYTKWLDDYVLARYEGTPFVDRQYDMFSPGLKCNVSWNSTKQVLNFFSHLGIKPEEKGKPSLNKNVLRSYLPTVLDEEKHELLSKYIKFKQLKQATSTFGKDFFKYVHPLTNRLYSGYNQVLNTGRISSSSPNLQNIPADLGFRRAFDAPPGWKIVNADYSGQEQIILANKSNDPELQQFYIDGHSDMHSFIASKIFKELNGLPLDEIKSKHKGKRQIAKAAGFAINYGGTGYTIAKNLGISEEEGDKVYDAYFAAFPNLKKYFDRVQRETLSQGYVLIDPITRRKSWFKAPADNREKNAIKRKALNFPIQGEAGGITKLAPVLFRDWILENDLRDVVKITNLVHDEINLEVKEDYAELAARNLEICMQEAADIWCKTIKLSADAVITDFWNH